jgi:C-terminal processing protease CtpA/Prc
MKRKILEEVLSHRPDGPLYHYTKQAGLLGIIRKKEIWATHTQYLNDTREFLHAVQLIRDELTVARAAHGDETVRDALEAMGRGLPEPEVSNDEKRAALREMWESVGDPAGLAVSRVLCKRLSVG